MKKPSIALILSILLPGMGHIYLKKKSGIVMVLFYLAGVAALIFWADNMENVFDVILWLFILLLFAAYDSYRTGKRENKLMFSKSSDLQGEEIGPGEYYFRRPFSVHSTKPFPIYDSRGKVVCYLQRYYKNKKERLLELFTSMRFTPAL